MRRLEWDEELTEIDLDLTGALLEPPPQVVVVQDVVMVEDAEVISEEEDLPLLSSTDFVLTRISSQVAPSPRTWMLRAAPLAALILAWTFRVELVRFLGLI